MADYIEAAGCFHCERLILLSNAQACRCNRPVHIICGECAQGQDEDNLGDLLVTLA